MIKKFLALTLLIGASIFAVPAAEASTTSSNSLTNTLDPQISIRLGNRRRGYRTRSYIRTRNIRIGYRWYRETYRVTVYRNGQTTTQLISRVRIS